MQNLREIRARIKTVGNIRNITSAIQKISAARLVKARHFLYGLRKYTAEFKSIYDNLLDADTENVLFRKNKTGSVLFIVMAGDRGFCGSYNQKVFDASASFLANYEKKDIKLIVCGKKGLSHFSRRNYDIIMSKTNIPPLCPYNIPGEIADSMIGLYAQNKISQVYAVSTEFVTMVNNTPAITKLLPAEPGQANNAASENYVFEPKKQELANNALLYYIKLRLWQSLVESSVSENTSRVVMMERATISAEEMISTLRLTGNKIRQSGITRELSDIVGTAEALA